MHITSTATTSLLFCLLPRTNALALALPSAKSVSSAPTFDLYKWLTTPDPSVPHSEYKYFFEAGYTATLNHYDARFFRSLVPYEEHGVALRHLIRSYLHVCRTTFGVQTWLAHGTLLGWWWNGRIMPWDYDLDVQVSNATLSRLARDWNRTWHDYAYWDAAERKEVRKTYLLDVNPFHGERTRLEGMNLIDARWIDVSNGMFVDITGLADRDGFVEDPTWGGGRTGSGRYFGGDGDGEDVTEPVKKEERSGREKKGELDTYWSCKNYHRYNTRDLYPLRETEFEGVTATVPYNFETVLTEEYGARCLVTTEWLG